MMDEGRELAPWTQVSAPPTPPCPSASPVCPHSTGGGHWWESKVYPNAITGWSNTIVEITEKKMILNKFLLF